MISLIILTSSQSFKYRTSVSFDWGSLADTIRVYSSSGQIKKDSKENKIVNKNSAPKNEIVETVKPRKLSRPKKETVSDPESSVKEEKKEAPSKQVERAANDPRNK